MKHIWQKMKKIITNSKLTTCEVFEGLRRLRSEFQVHPDDVLDPHIHENQEIYEEFHK